jgi:hypothetical protein
LSVAIYYKLDDFFEDAKAKENLFVDIDKSIKVAVCASYKKYKKYYAFVNTMNVYYIAIILDPQIKCKLLNQELKEEGAKEIKQQIQDFLHQHYLSNPEPELALLITQLVVKSIGSRFLEKI